MPTPTPLISKPAKKLNALQSFNINEQKMMKQNPQKKEERTKKMRNLKNTQQNALKQHSDINVEQ
jgi:hypothetical protein